DNLDAETLPEIRNRQQASQDLRKLRARMTQMGEVNLGAIEEVQRLEERMTFLITQRADLTDARDNLLRVITEIDSETRERFMNTLNQLREAFAEVFTRLFGGGTTNIKLNDQENVLESGLDIIVQPPGKKPQSMLLLSGGERALTAAAFLFALLKIKPSPFVLLDEVDAPMDESNVLRFAAMVHEFSENSQFIVISHNKGTMEVADVLYGISMPEPGVSRIISARLDDLPDAA
ncbi:MAG TPA: chromosome segregation protein SMC, partial [Armatimonadota bacterium]|nr:chromosome segregation protein SMC [Armatimonadota bacterium]